jgi:diguanylate cyclase (GGDEF)-like protein
MAGAHIDTAHLKQLMGSEPFVRMLQSEGDGVWVVQAPNAPISFSLQLQALLDCPPTAENAKAFAQDLRLRVHPEDAPRAAQAFASLVAGNDVVSGVELRIRIKSGGYFWRSFAAAVIERDREGRINAMTGIVSDIHRYRFAEQTQAALYKISEAAQADDDFAALLARIHHIIAELIPAKNLFVALLDSNTQIVSFPYYVDEHDEVPTPRVLSDRGLSHRVIRTGQPVLMKPDMRAERIAKGEQIIGTVCMDWLGVPLFADGRVIGALVVQSYTGEVRYTERDMTLLQFVSNQVASSIIRKRHADRLAQFAHYDALTGAANRFLLEDRLTRAIARADRTSGNIALIYFDLDDFKPVNDNFGHAVGDALLCEVSRRVRAQLREVDTFARIGGDEFVVVLDDIRSQDEARLVANKLLLQVSSPFIFESKPIKVGASMGIATYAGAQNQVAAQRINHQQAMNDLLASADAALYRAKANGKGCVSL